MSLSKEEEANLAFLAKELKTANEILQARIEVLEKHFINLDEASFASAHRCVFCQGAVLPSDQTPLGYLCRHCGPDDPPKTFAQADERRAAREERLSALGFEGVDDTDGGTDGGAD